MTYKSLGATILVFYENGKLIGNLYQEVDGFWVFWQEEALSGFWSQHVLRQLADKLEELNADWDRQLHEDLEPDHPHRT